ncbi:LAME_0E01992g1_1 [Lachancea meyersii CBS 8951]|uniref:LAME_0E01992g1_1 n=1 Tax=Lachancea meyersii CBS 8951 TaxID=1266667 RepID=A0A1G4JFG9_9SACH|nr:LAME_0E01992g1_1 [Lachancea meyersii CBS 8951]
MTSNSNNEGSSIAIGTKQVVTSITVNGAVFCAFVVIFLVQRLKLKRIYEPKSSFDLINDEKKPEPLPRGVWQWFLPLLKKSDNFIIQQAGLDGYFFIRYLFIIASFLTISCLYILPILLPINAANGVAKTGLEMLAYSNVDKKERYYAHVFVGWAFYWSFLFVIYRELVYYTSLRQVVMASPRYAKKLSSRTVLFQTVPRQFLSETEFSKLFQGVKRVWIARAASQLGKKVADREKMALKLEEAESALLTKAVKAIAKIKKKDPSFVPSSNILDYVPAKNRPQHRLKFLVGKKVDTIDYISEELPKLNAEVEELQKNRLENAPFNSVFVEFETQYAAQVAAQTIIHHEPLAMVPAHIGIAPKDVIWSNLRMFWFERALRKYAAVAFIVALVLLWTFPVAFVGMISQITYLTEKLPWLRFIDRLPSVLRGVLTSLTPILGLAILMMLLPIFIRRMAWLSGCPSVQSVEYFTQQSYFAFQVIQTFLVTTIASSATVVIPAIISEPTSAMSLLAQNLPKASNFFISYILLQGFSISSGALLQLVTLILFYVMGFLLDKTPRKKWTRFVGLGTMAWGTSFPVYNALTVIIFSYAIIAPIILLFGAVSFFLLYVAYLYNLTYVFKEAPDTKGSHYPRALYQTFVGLYIGQVCLLGLFVVGKGWGPIILQAIALGVTTFIHLNFNSSFDRLMQYVPVDAMKPLDGISDTPSFNNENKRKLRNSDIQELPHFPVKRYQPRSSPSADQKTSSVRSEHTYEIAGTAAYESENSVMATPLLADGEETQLQQAPFWKRYFQPHVYLSYKAVKNVLPEIYNLPDPNEEVSPDNVQHAYDYPAVSAKCPHLWIPRDPYGFSTIELAKLSEIVDISDCGASINEKGQVFWETAPPSIDKIDEFEKLDARQKNPFNEEDEDN